MSARHDISTILAYLKELFPPCRHERVVLVGGTVRDLILDRPCQDIDLATSIPPHELATLGFQLVKPTGAAAIHFKHHPLFGRIDVTVIGSMADLEQDLRRRDFTINAMAMDLSGDCIDPLNGTADLKNGLLRLCSDTAISADPLRIFRAFRFEADGWHLTADGESQIREREWSAPLAAVPVERFSNEMFKALALRQPERFFQLMIDCGVGMEFLPELFRMPHIPAGPLQHHPEGDLFSHSIQVLQRTAITSESPLARFCAFFHDIGKLATKPELYPKHHGHDSAGFSGAIAFCNRLALSTAHRNALAWVSALHGKANLWVTLRDSTKLKMADGAIKAGIVEILPVVAAADKAGGVPMEGWHDVVRVAEMSAAGLGIDVLQLEEMAPAKRAAFIFDKRLKVLRNMAK